MDPASGLAQASTGLAGAALQQPDLTGGTLGLRFVQRTARFEARIYAPFGHPALRIQRWRLARVHQKLADIKANSAGTDDGHLVGGDVAAQHHVEVAHHHRMIGTGEIHLARLDAGGQHDFVEVFQIGRLHRGVQTQLHAGRFDAMAEVTQGLVELFLARNAPGDIELPADRIACIEQGHPMPAFCRHRRAGQTGRAGTDHGNALGRGSRGVVEFGLVCGTRVDQAAGQLVVEHVIQAGLVTGNARIDGVRLPGARLVGPLRVGQQRPRQRHHVCGTVGQDALGHLRHVDAVGCHHRNAQMRLELGSDPGKRGARHRGGDGGNARFVPADTGIDDGRAGRFDRLRLGQDFLPLVAVFDQIHQRQPVDDDEVRPARLADAPHDLYRKAHALARIAAPGVAAPIGARGGEFVDQIAFRAHDLDAVVARLAR